MILARVKRWSRSESGDTKLSQNFTVREFACNDGSDLILIDPLLVEYLQALREHVGMPVRINSGYRSPAYNRRVKGAKDSFHTRGQAADIWVSNNTPRQVYLTIERGEVPGINPQKIGLGLYKTFVHIDTRGSRGRWAGTGVKLP